MAAVYTPITAADLAEWLSGARRPPETIRPPGTAETVLYWPIPGKPYGVAVFTSLEGGESREAGKDAIRVVVYHREADRVLSGTTRIHRTQGWRNRLADRIREVYRRARQWPACPTCAAPMVDRKNQQGRPFWGCSRYPACRGTRPA